MSAMRRCTCFIICLLTSYTYGTTELVEYTRGDIEFDSSNGEKIIDISTTKGIRCEWKVSSDYYTACFKWKFIWDQVDKYEVAGFSGQITVNYTTDSEGQKTRTVKVNLTDPGGEIWYNVSRSRYLSTYYASYNYTLEPQKRHMEAMELDKYFAPVDDRDAVLIVEGKKLHVSSCFLSFHSTYFHDLFEYDNSTSLLNIEIPVEGVSYEDLGLLLSVVHSTATFPNDGNSKKLLELASQFQTPYVLGLVENHLLTNTFAWNETLMLLADKYGLMRLLGKSIRRIDSIEKARQLKDSVFLELSDSAKVKVAYHMIQLL